MINNCILKYNHNYKFRSDYVMIKVIESIEAGNSKQRILECVSDMDSVCRLLKKIIPTLHDEEELKNIEKIIVDVSDNLDSISFDEDILQDISIIEEV